MTNQEFIESVALEGEEWRDVVGYEGYYMVSSFGRVVSLSKSLPNRYSIRRTRPMILKPTKKQVNDNYCNYYVSLRKNNLHKKISIHRIVAIAFIPNPYNFPEIDHIDTDTSNNYITNLRWCTKKQNMNNPITKTKSHNAKIGKPIPKLQKPIVQLSNGVLINTFSCISETLKLGFMPCKISMCCNNLRKSHKGYEWMFLSDYETQVSMSKNSNIPRED